MVSGQNKKIRLTKKEINEAFKSLSYKRIKEKLISLKDVTFIVGTCTICIDKLYDKQQCRILSCFHIFHKKCVTKWLLKDPSCPTCQKKFITKEDMKQFDLTK